MGKKDLITVRDYSYDTNTDELGYYRPDYVSAKEYVSSVIEELKGRKEKTSDLITTAQYAAELRASQYKKDNNQTKDNPYMTNVYEMKKAV